MSNPEPLDHLCRSARNGFAADPLDRSGPRRRDEAWVAAKLEDPTTRFWPLWRSRVLLHRGDPLGALTLSAGEVAGLLPRAAVPVLLGQSEGCVHFALDLDPSESDWADRLPGKFHSLRAVAPLLNGAEASLLAYAKAVTHWHRHQRFCGRCGSATASREGGHVRACSNPACGELHFPRTDPAVIVLITRGSRCLLARQASWPPRRYSVIAGFVEPGETLEAAVVREAREETGLALEEIRYHSSQPWPFPRSIMLGFTARATTSALRGDDEELEEARWFTRPEVVQGLTRGSLRLPPPLSISFRLIEDWFEGPGQPPLRSLAPGR